MIIRRRQIRTMVDDQLSSVASGLITTEVAYNPKKKVYEAECPDGRLMTSFVFPANLKGGDVLTPLECTCFDGEVTFTFRGVYDVDKDSINFFLEGDEGFSYKASLQVDAAPDEPYSWKLKRHGKLRSRFEAEAGTFVVPRSSCLYPQRALLDSEQVIVKRWSFYGATMSDKFARLRLKVDFRAESFSGKSMEIASITDVLAEEKRMKNLEQPGQVGSPMTFVQKDGSVRSFPKPASAVTNLSKLIKQLNEWSETEQTKPIYHYGER